MSYLVLARKWRPKSFDQVVGQEHIGTTLKNAISLNRVAHAYLFCGPRGIGKTSTARILARALNCAEGPTPQPCNKCDSCVEISEGRSMDAVEIDGASNRGIEQIRQLRQNVKFAPAKSRFKIYIIDEVHQITPDGFNALLKTLEEPPAHVKFIFATTQVHKVLPTIISRCQRFDFKPLSAAFIADKLQKIVKSEKLNVTEEAVHYIARAAAGSMRDAESILDQLNAFCRGEVNLEKVNFILGTIAFDALWQVAQRIIERKTQETLLLLEEIINEGKDLAQFVAGLMEHFRNILIIKMISGKNALRLIDLPRDYFNRIAEQTKDLSIEEIFYIFNVLVRTQEHLRRALSARVIVEMSLIKLAQREKISSLENILERLGRLEKNLGRVKDLQESLPPEPKAEIPMAPEPKNNPAPPASVEGPPADFAQQWAYLLELLKEEKVFVGSSLEFGKVVKINDNMVTIAFPQKHNFYKETLERPENKKIIETKVQNVFRRNLGMRFIVDKDLQVPAEEPVREDLSKKASSEPIIQSALKMFEGRIVRHTAK